MRLPHERLLSSSSPRSVFNGVLVDGNALVGDRLLRTDKGLRMRRVRRVRRADLDVGPSLLLRLDEAGPVLWILVAEPPPDELPVLLECLYGPVLLDLPPQLFVVLSKLVPVLPELVGGSADLTGSNLTKVKGQTDFQPPSTNLGTYAGTYIRYGVREHGMGAIGNGLVAYGGIIPYVATFLVRSCCSLAVQCLITCTELRLIWCWRPPFGCLEPPAGYLGRHARLHRSR